MEGISTAKAKIEDLKVERNRVEEEIQKEQALQEAARRSVQVAKERTTSKNQEIQQAKDLFQQLSRRDGENSTNTYMGYPRGMDNLVRAIERENRFQQKPIGPMGKYITLRDPKWSSIVEMFFGNNLAGFIVTSHADSRLLMDLMKRTSCSTPVFVASTGQMDIQEPDPKYPTILRILNIHNELVWKQLVILHTAEQAILIEDLEEANRVMGARSQRDNIAQCYALNALKPGFGHKVGGTIGVMSVTPVQKFERIRRIQVENLDQKKAAQDDIARLQSELGPLESAFQNAKCELSGLEKSINDHKRLLRELRTEMQREEDQIDRLTTQIEEMQVDGQLNILQQRLNVKSIHPSTKTMLITFQHRLRKKN